IPIGILGIPPDIVAVPAAGLGGERHTPVGRAMHAAVHDDELVGIARRDTESDVIAGAADQRAVPADDLPRRAPIIRAPQRSLVGCLDERVDATRVGRRNRDINLPNGRSWKTRMLDSLPRLPAIARRVDRAAWPTAQ